MKYKLLSICFLMVFLITNIAFAKPQVYTATVEDGTPKVISPDRNLIKDSDSVKVEHSIARPKVQAKPVHKVAKEVAKAKPLKDEDAQSDQELSQTDSSDLEPGIMGEQDEESDATGEEIDENTDQSISETQNTQTTNESTIEPTLKKDGENTSAPTRKPIAEFDRVQSKKQQAELRLRLKYTQELLKRYNLAYDYRITTSKQFKQILKKLEKAHSK